VKDGSREITKGVKTYSEGNTDEGNKRAESL
jgi:hypothetical protein